MSARLAALPVLAAGLTVPSSIALAGSRTLPGTVPAYAHTLQGQQPWSFLRERWEPSQGRAVPATTDREVDRPGFSGVPDVRG